jgi:hypothetical protein
MLELSLKPANQAPQIMIWDQNHNECAIQQAPPGPCGDEKLALNRGQNNTISRF